MTLIEEKKTIEAFKLLKHCRLCGHGCGADRLAGELGGCGSGRKAWVTAHLLHFGEEPPIGGTRGSGTIFFSGCPLSCVFCQNHQISQTKRGREVSASELAEMMLDLENQGAHNVNLVSPTSWIPQIITALIEAREAGLDLPVVYNTGGFDSVSGLKALDGLVDIYLPDAKFHDQEASAAYCGAGNYPHINRAALKEMFRQVGTLRLDKNGLAVKGVLVRHLVLPHNLARTDSILNWLAAEFGNDQYLSLMAQYNPAYRVLSEPHQFAELTRPLTEAEYEAALDAVLNLGFENVFIQELDSSGTYNPDFDQSEIFK